MNRLFKHLFLTLLISYYSVSLYATEIDYGRIGDVVQIVLPVTALGMTLGMEEDYNGTVQFVKSFGATFVATQVLKYGVNETRPNGGHHSFPSGHTSAAFSGASFIQRRYGWGYGIPAYLAATYVGWSRVYTHAHYPHDVYVGALLGIAMTYLFTVPYKESNVQVSPMVSTEGYGFVLAKQF